jgi:hypothetical protein
MQQARHGTDGRAGFAIAGAMQPGFAARGDVFAALQEWPAGKGIFSCNGSRGDHHAADEQNPKFVAGPVLLSRRFTLRLLPAGANAG